MAEPMRVLVVDDEPDMVGTLLDILESAGYAVDVASSGEEAIDRCRSLTPSCVLMDVVMPGLDGLDTLREMRRWVPEVPVLFMTATVTSDLVRQAAVAGAREVLPKPLDLESMLARLSRIGDEPR